MKKNIQNGVETYSTVFVCHAFACLGPYVSAITCVIYYERVVINLVMVELL